MEMTAALNGSVRWHSMTLTTSRRLILDTWAKDGHTACSGIFNNHPVAWSPRLGSHHAVELPLSFQLGHWPELISRMWVSFVVDLDPNKHGGRWRKSRFR
jgi:hypothetical protein